MKIEEIKKLTEYKKPDLEEIDKPDQEELDIETEKIKWLKWDSIIDWILKMLPELLGR